MSCFILPDLFRDTMFSDLGGLKRKIIIQSCLIYKNKSQCLLISSEEHNFCDHALQGVDAHPSLAMSYFLVFNTLLLLITPQSLWLQFSIDMYWMTKELNMFAVLPKTSNQSFHLAAQSIHAKQSLACQVTSTSSHENQHLENADLEMNLSQRQLILHFPKNRTKV